jgi:hypothetical protein
MGKELIRVSYCLLAIRLERGVSAVPTPTNIIVVKDDIEETILTTHLRLVLSGGALGRPLWAGRSVVTHLATAVADDAHIGERVLRVLHLDIVELFLGDLWLLAVRGSVSNLTAAEADDFPIHGLAMHVASLWRIATTGRRVHMIRSELHFVALDVHPILRVREIGELFKL